MKHTHLYPALLLLLYAAPVYAQKEIEKHWGSPGYDGAFSAAATKDGGYVISGLTQSMGNTAGDIIVLKINSSGDTTWTLQYGGDKLEGGNNVIQTADGGILVSGHTEDFGAHDCDAFLMKLDMNGNRQWFKIYGGEEDDIAEGTVELADGGFVTAGISASYGNPIPSDLRHSWFIRTNSTGDTLWTRCYGGDKQDYGYSIASTAAGGFLAVGYTMSRGQGEQDGWLLRIKDNGDTLWTHTYAAGGDTRFFQIIPTIDKGFILAGYTQPLQGSKALGLIVKTDAAGNELWQKTFGGENDDIEFHSVAQLPNGNLMFSGVNHKEEPDGNAYVLITDEYGAKMNEFLFGGAHSYANSIAVQGNNNYLAAGYSSKWGDPAGDLFYIESSNTGIPLSPENTTQYFIYPNPVKNKSPIILPSVYAYQNVQLDVTDMTGRLVASHEKVLGKDVVIDRKGLSAGSYIFRVSCNDGKVFNGKFTVEQ